MFKHLVEDGLARHGIGCPLKQEKLLLLQSVDLGLVGRHDPRMAGLDNGFDELVYLAINFADLRANMINLIFRQCSALAPGILEHGRCYTDEPLGRAQA